MDADALFAPPPDAQNPSAVDGGSGAWMSISPKLALVRRLDVLASVAVIAPAVIAVLYFTDAPWQFSAAVAAVAVLIAVTGWVVSGRRVRAWGYAERDDDLLVKSGVLNRRLVVVPYGRMQFVDVTAGPVDRLAGVATLRLHTAAATSDVVIPGLVPEEAARLRDRLAARGEATRAGL